MRNLAQSDLRLRNASLAAQPDLVDLARGRDYQWIRLVEVLLFDRGPEGALATLSYHLEHTGPTDMDAMFEWVAHKEPEIPR